jgi:hypothetical protein
MIFSAIGAIVTGIGGLLSSTFLGGSLGTMLLKAAVGIGINLAAQAVAGQPEGPSFAVQGKLQSGGDVPRSFPLGYTATAGSLAYANTWGHAGKTPNAYLTQVISLSDLPIGGLVELWVNGEKVTLPAMTGTAPYEQGWPIAEYEKDGGDNNLWIKFYDGTQTVADPFLVGKVSSAERPYENTRVGRGVAYAIVTSQVREDLFTGFPSFKFAVNGAKLYDISKDSTAGGAGTHRWSDPSTWGGDGDHLPAVQIYNLGRGITYAGQWFYGLQGVTAARLPAAHWIGQIQKCRTTITSGGATVPTYRSGGEIAVSAQIGDAFEGLLTSCQGRLSEAGGVYKLFLGAPGAPVASFDDGVIISTEEQSFTPFFGLADTINGISAKHPNPAEGWNVKVAPPIYRADLEALSGNRRLLADVSFDFVPYADQVQRLMKSAIEEAQRARRHTFVLPPEYWVLEPGDIVSWTSARNGYVTKLFRVDGVVDRANLDVMVDLTEVDPADYDWNDGTDYRVPVDGPVGPARPVPQPIIDWAAVASSVTDAAGTQRRPAILLSWDGDQRDVAAVAFEIRKASNLAVDYRGRTDNPEAGAILISQNLLPLTDYQVRGRYLPRSDRETLWSDWLPVTTLNLLINSVDILDNAITRNKIADAAIDANKLANEAVTNLKLADQAVSTAKLQVAAVTAEILANGAVISSKIADAALTVAKFASGIRPVEILGALPATGNFAGRMVFLTTDSKLYRHTGTPSGAAGFTAATGAADIIGQLTDAQIADISAAKLTGQIVGTQISDNAISTPKLAAGAVSTAKLAAGAVTADIIAANAVTTAKIAAGAVTANELSANSVTSDKILAGSIIAGKIAAGAVGATEIAAQSVRATKLLLQDYSNIFPDYDMLDPDFYVGSDYAFFGSSNQNVGQRFLRVNSTAADNFVYTQWFPVEDIVEHFVQIYAWIQAGGTGNITLQFGTLDGAGNVAYDSQTVIATPVSTSVTRFTLNFTPGANIRRVRLRFWNFAASTSSINCGGIVLRRKANAELIVDGSIIADKLAVNSVTTAKIAAGAITATEIATGAITAIKLQAGSVTAAAIAGNTITGDKLVANSITAREMILTDYTNLLQAPSMDDAGGWIGVGGASIITSALGYNSNRCGSVGSGGQLTNVNNRIKCTEGDQFMTVGIARRYTAAGGDLRLYTRFYDKDDGALGTYFQSWTTAETAYTRKSAYYTAPAGTNYALVYWIGLATITSGIYLAGYAGLFRRANAELIVDGSITAAKANMNSLLSVNASITGLLSVGPNIDIDGINNRILIRD